MDGKSSISKPSSLFIPDLEFINPDVSPQLIEDVISSLVALGYKNENAKKICKELQKKGELVGELETIIKKALRH